MRLSAVLLLLLVGPAARAAAQDAPLAPPPRPPRPAPVWVHRPATGHEDPALFAAVLDSLVGRIPGTRRHAADERIELCAAAGPAAEPTDPSAQALVLSPARAAVAYPVSACALGDGPGPWGNTERAGRRVPLVWFTRVWWQGRTPVLVEVATSYGPERRWITCVVAPAAAAAAGGWQVQRCTVTTVG